MPFIVTEVSPAGAAEITDFDCRRPTSAADMEALRAAFRQWPVLCIREQHMSPAEQAAFARQWGPLERQDRAQHAGDLAAVEGAGAQRLPEGALPDDAPGGAIGQGGVDAQGAPLHARPGGPPRQRLEGAKELGAAIRVAGVVHGVHAEEDVLRPQHLGDRKSTRLNSSHIPLSRMPSSA